VNQNELACWLVLNRCPGFGPRRFAALLQQEESLSNCFSEGAPRPDFLAWCQAQGVKSWEPNWAGVDKDLAWAQQPHCHIVTGEDPAYPAQLKEISSSPPILFVQGAMAALTSLQIAMVGSRHPSEQGKDNAFHFAYELCQHGFAITSGLALGIDTAAHEGALASNGTTVAVLGHGLDTLYPSKNRALAEQILCQGVLVSEFPIGTLPKAGNFPRRNRIISGLSLGVLVVEAALQSGSLITTKYALEQGKEIFAIPGSIQNPLAKGCHQLIRQGAKCVESLEHMLEELPAQLHPQAKTFKPARLPRSQPASGSGALHPLLPHIDVVCTPIDVMVHKTGLTTQQLSSMLLELELQGCIQSVPGGYIRR